MASHSRSEDLLTVRREREIYFNGSERQLSEATERVLRNHPEYRVKTRSADAWTLEIRPRLWPMMLSTSVDLTLRASSSAGASLLIRTSSQRLVFGDVFGFYNRYIDRLAERVRRDV